MCPQSERAERWPRELPSLWVLRNMALYQPTRCVPIHFRPLRTKRISGFHHHDPPNDLDELADGGVLSDSTSSQMHLRSREHLFSRLRTAVGITIDHI